MTGPAAAPSQAQAEGCAAAAMSVVVAAGPFTTSEDLSFQPLSDLLAYCAGEEHERAACLDAAHHPLTGLRGAVRD